MTQEYGDVARLALGYYLISHPDDVCHVLQENRDNYWRGSEAHRRSGGLFGKGLVFNDGEDWRRQRRLLTPAFAPQAVARYVPIIAAQAQAMLQRWSPLADQGSPIDVKAEMLQLTQDIILRAISGAFVRESGARVAEAMTVLSEYVAGNVGAPIHVPARLPTPRNLRFRKALRTLDAMLADVVAQGCQGGPGGTDILSALLAAGARPGGRAMSKEQLRDELVTLFIAGHETTAHTLSWLAYLLSKHPEVQRRLGHEVDRVLAGRPPIAADLDRLEYADKVIRETLRLYPPAWILVREPYTDDVVGGSRIPARSTLLISPYVTHHRPDIWENPEGFDPERFSPENEFARPRFAWYPFGGGPRLCLGRAFAMAELKLVLALLTQHYRLELQPGHSVRMDPKLTLAPAGELWMTVRHTSPSTAPSALPSRAHSG